MFCVRYKSNCYFYLYNVLVNNLLNQIMHLHLPVSYCHGENYQNICCCEEILKLVSLEVG